MTAGLGTRTGGRMNKSMRQPYRLWQRKQLFSLASLDSAKRLTLSSGTTILLINGPTIMNKSLGTLLRFWGVFQFTQVQPLPSPHKQCWTRVSRIFSEIQFCIGWGGGGGGEGELHENFENDAVLRGSREMTEKYAYCSTVPRTFV